MLPEEFRVNFTIKPRELLVSPFMPLGIVVLTLVPWGANTAPAWVQAMGSITAIFVAIWVVKAQANHQVLERRRKAYQYLFRARLVALHAVDEMRDITGSILGHKIADSNVNYYLASLANCQRELSGFTYSEMVDYEFAESWHSAYRAVCFLHAKIEESRHSMSDIGKRMSIHKLHDHYDELEQELYEALLKHTHSVGPEVYQDLHL